QAPDPAGAWAPAAALGGYQAQAPPDALAALPGADVLGFGAADNGLATMLELESFTHPGKCDQLLGHVPGIGYEEGWWYPGPVNPAHPAGYACAADFGGAGHAPFGWGASRTGEAFPFEVMPAVGAAAPRMQYSAPPAPSLSLLSGNRFGGPASSWASSGA
ncbi:unnamed protein product, partial [Prorocentrum cordatum]